MPRVADAFENIPSMRKQCGNAAIPQDNRRYRTAKRHSRNINLCISSAETSLRIIPNNSYHNCTTIFLKCQ
jgi:hypothetical protein